MCRSGHRAGFSPPARGLQMRLKQRRSTIFAARAPREDDSPRLRGRERPRRLHALRRARILQSPGQHPRGPALWPLTTRLGPAVETQEVRDGKTRCGGVGPGRQSERLSAHDRRNRRRQPPKAGILPILGRRIRVYDTRLAAPAAKLSPVPDAGRLQPQK